MVVVSVRQLVGQARAVVGGLRESVGHTEVQARRRPPLQTHLQAVVAGRAGILRQPDDADPAEGAQEIHIDARIGLDRAWQQLIEIALPLVVQAAPSYVPDLYFRGPG